MHARRESIAPGCFFNPGFARWPRFEISKVFCVYIAVKADGHTVFLKFALLFNFCCGAILISRCAHCISQTLYSQKSKRPACLCRFMQTGLSSCMRYLQYSGIRWFLHLHPLGPILFPLCGHKPRRNSYHPAIWLPQSVRHSFPLPGVQSHVHRRPWP